MGGGRAYELEISPEPVETEREALARAAREVFASDEAAPPAYRSAWWRSGLPDASLVPIYDVVSRR